MKYLPWLLLAFTLCACLENREPGLVVYFPFDGGADEKMGDSESLTIEGPTLSTDRFGAEESSYYFDGKDDQLYGEVNNLPGIESPQSICWWYMNQSVPVFSDPMGAGNMIVLADREAGTGIQFGFRAPGYGTRGLDGWNWGGKTLLEAYPQELNAWHFCVYTYDSFTHKLYIDGIETASSTELTQKGIPKILMFGNYPGGDQYFEGKLDEVRIYNRVLTDSEINALYLK